MNKDLLILIPIIGLVYMYNQGNREVNLPMNTIIMAIIIQTITVVGLFLYIILKFKPL